MYRILAAALLALALAPPAFAKEVQQVTACGADGCRTAKSPPPDVYAVMPPQQDAREVPFYRLKLGFGDGSGKVVHTLEVLYAPETGMIADEEQSPNWLSAAPKTRRLAERLTRGLEPFPASAVPIAVPAARVDEVVTPEAAAVTPPADGGGGPPWAILVGAAVVAALLVLTLARRRGASRAARSASPPPSPARG